MKTTEKLTAIITRGEDHFAAWFEEIEGVYGAGDTVEEAKENLQEGLNLYLDENKTIPEVLKGEYQITYKFDTAAFLQYYGKILSKSGLEKITGVNQKQLGHYLSGHRKPGSKTVQKIDEGLHKFAEELSQIHFVE